MYEILAHGTKTGTGRSYTKLGFQLQVPKELGVVQQELGIQQKAVYSISIKVHTTLIRTKNCSFILSGTKLKYVALVATKSNSGTNVWDLGLGYRIHDTGYRIYQATHSLCV